MAERNITNWDEVPVIMDLAYASRIIKQSPEYLRQRAKKGLFPAYKEGEEWRVEKAKLRQYIHERCVVKTLPQETDDEKMQAAVSELIKVFEAVKDKLFTKPDIMSGQ